jgi:hypothetical protein
MNGLCVYCGVDCTATLALDHDIDCPTNTGLYPILDYQIDTVCCADGCDVVFAAGDFYVEHPLAVDIVEMWCLDCAARAATTT